MNLFKELSACFNPSTVQQESTESVLRRLLKSDTAVSTIDVMQEVIKAYDRGDTATRASLIRLLRGDIKDNKVSTAPL